MVIRLLKQCAPADVARFTLTGSDGDGEGRHPQVARAGRDMWHHSPTTVHKLVSPA
jgi:hypothetical protein